MNTKELEQELCSTKEQLSLCSGELDAAVGRLSDAYLEVALQIRGKQAAQKDNAVLREALGKLKMAHHVSEDCWYSCPESSEGCCDSRQQECNCGAKKHNEIIEQALSQTPTDIICITREELMEPSSGMVDETLLFYEDNEHYWAGYDAEYIKASWKVLITQLLKEREDK